MAKRQESRRKAKAAPKAKSASTRRSVSGPVAAFQVGWGRPQGQPIDLYYWGTPNGWKISIMLEECGLPYTIEPVNIGRGEQFEAKFEAISPNMRIPAIVDPEGPDGNPISVFESGAILEYLGRKTGKFYARDERHLVQLQECVYWQMANLGPLAGQAHHFRLYAPEKIPYAIQRYETQVKRLYVTLDKRLERRDYICGDYSIADIASFGWARRLERQGQNVEDFPNVKRWLAAIEARPAVMRALAIKIDVPPTDLKSDDRARQFLFQRVGR
jgi:GST-like protein